jgi:hypothetical protein
VTTYVFEDTNDTLPDFLSVTLDESVSTRVPSQILVSPNTIWVNDESYVYGENEFVRLVVTLSDLDANKHRTASVTLNAPRRLLRLIVAQSP